ncbi:MAG: DUF488 domain-containing protein [Acidimicrobiales bacterium]
MSAADSKAGVAVVRVYDAQGRQQGEHRVLVDRLWPRGLAKAAVDYDAWDKDVAPSTELRRWYSHDPTRFPEFARRYRIELAAAPGASSVERLRSLAAERRLVLLTATRDAEHSGAAVLQDVLTGIPEK